PAVPVLGPGRGGEERVLVLGQRAVGHADGEDRGLVGGVVLAGVVRRVAARGQRGRRGQQAGHAEHNGASGQHGGVSFWTWIDRWGGQVTNRGIATGPLRPVPPVWCAARTSGRAAPARWNRARRAWWTGSSARPSTACRRNAR